jgi:colanic acid biosynthesis glycosyl transferase WcaI
MRILIIGINYYPERTSVSPFTTGLSEHLAAQGHDVRAITAFPYYPEWRIWDGYRGHITWAENLNGVQLRRVIHFVPWKPSSLLQRLMHDFSFGVTALIAGLVSGPCDVIYCASPPPAAALAAYVLSKWKRVPYVIKLTDLASEAAAATQILREDGWGIRLAKAVEDFVYRRAKTIFCLCEGFIEKIRSRGITPSKLLLIPDWGDTEAIRPVPSDGSFRKKHGISPNSFVLLHTGNMGKKQGLINIVHAAELSRKDETLVWVIVGEGEERKLVESEIRTRGLTNIRLLPLQPRESMCQMYAAADVLLLTQTALVKDSVIPSKLLTYLASGRPVMASVNVASEAAQLVHRANCGVVVPPEDPHALAQGACALRTDTIFRSSLNGREYAEGHFTKAHVLSAYDQYFETLFHPESALALVADKPMAAD